MVLARQGSCVAPALSHLPAAATAFRACASVSAHLPCRACALYMHWCRFQKEMKKKKIPAEDYTELREF